MKFLATPAAANAWAARGRLRDRATTTSASSVYPDAIDRADQQAVADGEVGRLRHVGRAAGVVRLDDRPGRVGDLPDVPARTRATSRASRSSSRRRRRRRTRRASSALSAGGITAEPPVAAAPPAPATEPAYWPLRHRRPRSSRPRSSCSASGSSTRPSTRSSAASSGQSGFLGNWVGIDNYKTLFTTSTLTTAIKNNAIWVAVVPAFVTRDRAASSRC